MKILKLTFFLCALCTTIVFGQEANKSKQLWAKSILNQKAPQIKVEKWLGETPNTKGKFVLVDFWATWCGPCRQIIPQFNAWHEKFADQLVIIGISDETEDKVKALTTEHPVYYEAIDTKATMKNQLEVVGIPHCILIDPNGIVRWEGFPLLQGNELTEKVLMDLMSKYKL